MAIQGRSARSSISEAIVREPAHSQQLAGRMLGSWEGVIPEAGLISFLGGPDSKSGR
jgi:hypothetical protein